MTQAIDSWNELQREMGDEHSVERSGAMKKDNTIAIAIELLNNALESEDIHTEVERVIRHLKRGLDN